LIYEFIRMKKACLIILLSFTSLTVFAQVNWELKKDKDGIAVYTGKVKDEKFKHVRAICTINTSIEKLIKVMQDVDHHKNWVYNTKVSSLVKRKGRDTVTYYTEVSLPWPVSNRDLVMQQSMTRDSINKTLKIEVHSVSGVLPEKPGKVRVPFSQGLWNITTVANNRIRIEYVFNVDPGGSIPAWLVNMLSTAGPFNTFKNLKSLLETGSVK
jgi:hypothetical protein